MKVPATPISLAACSGCGSCAKVCPMDAITGTECIITDAEKCIMCMACVAKCPAQARILPSSLQAGMTQKLGTLKEIRRQNEFYL